jgi:hypothetical protein
MVPENKGRRRFKRVFGTVVRVVALLVLAGTGALGIYNGITERHLIQTSLQAAVTYGVLLYGVLGLISALGVILRAHWSVWTTAAWAVTATFVAGTAVLAYGEPDSSPRTAATSYIAAALFTAAIIWAVRRVTRAKNDTASD